MACRWYAARVKTTISWDVIIEQLQRQGFTAYQPVISRSVYFGGRKMIGQWPLFPAYLFVSFDLEEQRWRSVNSTTGVHHLLPAQSEIPHALPIGFIEGLRTVKSERAEKLIEATRPFMANETVRILIGAYKNAVGTVINSTPKLTRVEINAFNRKVATTIATEGLAPAPRS